jgi:hypothetical protein
LATELSTEESVETWDPPADVRLHNGAAVPDDMDFFTPPPDEIGTVATAQSTLKTYKREMTTLSTALVRLGFAGAVAGGGYYLGQALGPGAEPMIGVLTGLGGFLGLLIGWAMTSFKHLCSYCGEHGVTEYTIKGSRQNEPKQRRLLFQDAMDLRTSQTRHYTNGIYTSTQYSFQWVDADGKKLLTLSGSYRSQAGTPKVDSPFWFASAAERLWNGHVADRMQAELDKNGFVEFRVNKKDRVRVGPGFMEFEFGGRTDRVTPADIKDLSISGGTFVIKTKEARWFSSKGKFSFNYGAMSNAQMFVFSLQQLMGYTFN